MYNLKAIIIILFCITFTCLFFETSTFVWITLTFIFLFVSILNLVLLFKSTIPFGELIGLVYLIENVVAVELLYILGNKSNNDIERYYMQVPIDQYLPYGLLASQAFLVGFILIKKESKNWINYINNFNNLIAKETLIYIIIISILSPLISMLHISAISFVGYVFSNLGLCGLVGFYLSGKGLKSNRYLILGLIINLIGTISTGMFTGLTLFIILIGIIYFSKSSSGKAKINWLFFFIIMVVGVIFMAYLQNLKADFRQDAWGEEVVSKNSNSSLLYVNALKNYDKITISDKNFYLPLLGRINQGWLVSCTMEKVPLNVPFENGKSIFTAFTDAILPRFINPDKQIIGNSRIKKYTNLNLIGSTAMGIGYLGESYVNFGIIGGVICMGILGLFLSYLESKILLISKFNPLVLTFLPFYFMTFLTSGNDFFWLFNNLTMASLIIYFVILYLSKKNKIWLKEKNIITKS